MNVRGFTLHPEQPAWQFWDQALLRWVFDFDPADLTDEDRDCVVVIPGRMNYDREAEIAERLNKLDRCVLVVTGDEEARFDPIKAAPNAVARWVQTPHTLPPDARFLPLGAPPHHPSPRVPRDFTWCFAGQITHDRRRACVDASQSLPGGILVATDRFAAGIPPDAYTALLARSQLAPCPSGPVHPETFRLYEALEAGCIPIADARTPGGEWGAWWQQHFPDRPFPLVSDWAELPDIAPALLDGWQTQANRCTAWWKNRKLDVARDLAADAGVQPDQITVVVTMSPIPSHPSLGTLAETVTSLLEWGPAGEIIVTCDGARPDDNDEAYQEAIAALCHRALHDRDWRRVRVLLADRWVHQANLLRMALEQVTTPLIVFSEHDTPLCGPVPWDDLAKIITSGEANMIRLAHEAQVHPEHRHLMLDAGPTPISGVPLWRTMQYSARPHLAAADWYRQILTDWFPTQSKGFIEDHIYSPIVEHDWEWSRLFLYCPDGDIKRSWHTDGRAGAEKAPAFLPG